MDAATVRRPNGCAWSAVSDRPTSVSEEEDGRQIRDQDYREQGVTKAGAAREAGDPVARIHVAGRHQVIRAGKGEELAPRRGSGSGHTHRAEYLPQGRRCPVTPPYGRRRRSFNIPHSPSGVSRTRGDGLRRADYRRCCAADRIPEHGSWQEHGIIQEHRILQVGGLPSVAPPSGSSNISSFSRVREKAGMRVGLR
jgi:hypothetical protein